MFFGVCVVIPGTPGLMPVSVPLSVQGCYEAFKRRLNASHSVSCVPGAQAVTGKASLVGSLQAAYGEGAWGIVPRSFRLPQQYSDMVAHLKQVGLHAASKQPPSWRCGSCLTSLPGFGCQHSSCNARQTASLPLTLRARLPAPERRSSAAGGAGCGC